jgi:hypothetical protein
LLFMPFPSLALVLKPFRDFNRLTRGDNKDRDPTAKPRLGGASGRSLRAPGRLPKQKRVSGKADNTLNLQHYS